MVVAAKIDGGMRLRRLRQGTERRERRRRGREEWKNSARQVVLAALPANAQFGWRFSNPNKKNIIQRIFTVLISSIVPREL
jgi:hypothetical protein